MKEITTVFPFKTKSISVTGNRCSFNCSHCGRKYLQSMESISDTIKLGKRNFTSVLISGGMNIKGYVPLDEYEDEIRKIKELGLK
ncbi:radical SAM protein, partial [bacterium]|nr:radical SAM protein [bacterium]